VGLICVAACGTRDTTGGKVSKVNAGVTIPPTELQRLWTAAEVTGVASMPADTTISLDFRGGGQSEGIPFGTVTGFGFAGCGTLASTYQVKEATGAPICAATEPQVGIEDQARRLDLESRILSRLPPR